MKRKVILATNEIYHVYNRGVEKRPIFLKRPQYLRFLNVVNYYRFKDCSVKFSHFKELSIEVKNGILKQLEKQSQKLVNILAFCLMPNHIHFLLKQVTDTGITKFMRKVSNSYSHYFNGSTERTGYLFQGNFGAVRIEDDEQFIHVSRYIHLNPVSSYLIELKDLRRYEYSSYLEYLGIKTGFCNTKEVLSYFKSSKDYEQFVNDYADYARELEKIKHLILE